MLVGVRLPTLPAKSGIRTDGAAKPASSGGQNRLWVAGCPSFLQTKKHAWACLECKKIGSPSCWSAGKRYCRVTAPAFGPSVAGWVWVVAQQVFFKPDIAHLALVSEGRKEPVTGLRRHPLIDSIFPRLPGVSPCSRRGTSTSSSRQSGTQPLVSALLSLFNDTPPCRVLRGSEPAFAGGLLPGNSALARAYRVVAERLGP